MPITLNCPKCHKPFRVRDESIGGRVRCPSCGAVLQVPATLLPASNFGDGSAGESTGPTQERPVAEDVAAGVKGSMANKPMTYCLSAEDAAKGAEAMKEHMAKGKCQFNRFDVAGGTIDTAMSCQMGNGTLTATGHGTYTDTGTVVASTSDMLFEVLGTLHTYGTD